MRRLQVPCRSAVAVAVANVVSVTVLIAAVVGVVAAAKPVARYIEWLCMSDDAVVALQLSAI